MDENEKKARSILAKRLRASGNPDNARMVETISVDRLPWFHRAALEAVMESSGGTEPPKQEASNHLYWPFSLEEVAALSAWQACDWTHSLTCPHGHGDLKVMRSRLICPHCNYEQRWAPRECLSLPPCPSADMFEKTEKWSYYLYEVHKSSDADPLPYAVVAVDENQAGGRHVICRSGNPKDADTVCSALNGERLSPERFWRTMANVALKRVHALESAFPAGPIYWTAQERERIANTRGDQVIEEGLKILRKRAGL